ncbi:hypothetical protein E4T50_00505 [Aureobasidium sp. EXF-12298]|nr:hypothetical protein E4T50_00505 [Aureobasidium sp. EXF-12298]
MPAAQPVYLRASCLRWLPRESRHLSDSTNTRLPFLRPGYHARCTNHDPRGLRHASSKAPNGTKTPTPNTNGRDEQGNKSSLLEELFPEEAQAKPQASTRPKERDVPRLDVRASLSKATTRRVPKDDSLVRRVQKSDKNWWNRTEADAPEPTPVQDRQKRQRVEAVLLLRNASTTLVEDDFTRLIPQGLHIEGWTLDQADIVKVVPGRNTSTLERANFYFILFSSRPAMNSYRVHVQNLHSLASRHVQSSLTSPIPPPPGYYLDGHDVDALLQSYTLIPPSRSLQLLPLPMQVTPSVVDIIHNLGYPDIVKGPLREPYIVMIRLEGPQLPITMIKGVLSKVERERRIPWNREFGDLSYQTREPKSKNISPLDRKSRLDTSGRRNKNDWFNEIEEIAEMDAEVEEDEPEDNPSGPRERRKARCSYLFGFDTEDAALTFVQYWHRRPLEMTAMSYNSDDIAPVVDAELLW